MSYGIKLVDNGANLEPARFQELQGQLEKLYKEKGSRLTEADFQNFLAANKLDGQKLSFNEMPALAKPGLDYFIDILGEGGLSPGAAVMALITKDAAEQRKANKEMINLQTEEVVANIEEQASEMRNKAAVQLVMGVVSGAVNIAGGIVSLGIGMKGGNDLKMVSQQMAATGSIFQGVSGALGAVGQSTGTFMDANIKELEAKAERLKADRDILKEFNNSWSDLIQKTLSASDAIQQGMNQARAKILG
ncbi:MAG: type III secretion system translocon subunit SctB [Candidatus Adiutrix sp.]|jgi:hypothetical protein|nr:type III secretion system translocon subunit SctB [Candidatus Adiutrix sp.]